MSLYNISIENIRTDVKITMFPIPMAYKSRFRIFNQNHENSDRIQESLTFSCFGSNMIGNIIPEMTDKLCSTCNKSINVE